MKGPLVVCDSKYGGYGATRTGCGTAHYVMQDRHGHTAILRLTQEEARKVFDSELPADILSSLGLPQMAQEMLAGVRQAA